MRRLLLLALVLMPVAFAGDGPRVVDEWVAGERTPEANLVTAIAVFPGGQKILVATGEELKIADADGDFETKPFLKTDKHPRAAAITSDGRLVAAAGWYERQVTIYDAVRRKKVKALDAVENVFALGFSPRGDRLLVAGSDQEMAVLDVTTGKVVARTRIPSGPVGAGFTDDGEKAWFASAAGEVFLHDPETLACVRSYSLGNEVIAVAFAADGDHVVYCTRQKVERVNRLTLHRERFVLGEEPSVMGISPDGSLMVVAGESHRLTFVGAAPRGFKGHIDRIAGLAVAPDGRFAVSTGVDRTARLWRTKKGQHVRVLEQTEALGPVTFSPDGASVLLATRRGLEVLDPRTNEVVQRFPGLRDLGAVGFVTSGAFVREQSAEDSVSFSRAGERTWKLQVGQRFAPEAISGYPFALAVTPSRKRALVVASDLTLWDLEKPARLYVYENCPYAAASPIAFSPDEKLAAVYHSDHKLRVWKLEAPWAASLVDLGRVVPTAIAFAPDGSWLLVGTTKGRILKVELGSSR